MTLLLAGAFGPEIAPFSGHLPPDVAIAAVGIGLVDAALGTATAIVAHRARAVVFVGTCGAFAGSGLAIGDVVVLRDAVLTDLASAEQRAHLLPQLAAPVAGDLPLGRALVPEAPAVRVATVLGITTDDAAATAIAHATGAEVEHLEAYAVGRAAACAGLPFTAVLGIANPVGASGRAAWATNHAAVSTRVRDAMLQGLREGAFRGLLGAPPTTTL